MEERTFLPNEMVACILEWLDPKALGHVSCVSHNLREIAQTPSLWYEFYKSHTTGALTDDHTHELWSRYEYDRKLKHLFDGTSAEIEEAVTRRKLTYTQICAICRNNLYDLCVECLVHTPTDQPCEIAKGTCDHSYHGHCIALWLRTHTECPLDNREWLTQCMIPINTPQPMPIRDKKTTNWTALYYGEMQASHLLQIACDKLDEQKVETLYSEQLKLLESMGLWSRKAIIQALITTSGAIDAASLELLKHTR